MENQGETTNPMEVADPGKPQQEQCKDMMGEHLPKVLPLDIKELGN